MPARKPVSAPIVVVYGDEAFQKTEALRQQVDALLPPEVDRALALSECDGSRSDDQGGPSLAGVMDDLLTLPFLSDRRVVVIRDADRFISAHRDRLENYLKSPSPTGTLVLECRSFPSSTRLSKASSAAGGRLIECKKLKHPALVNFVNAQARLRGKRIDPSAANRLVARIGEDQAALANEVEKLDLYSAERDRIVDSDVDALVVLSREEKIFAVMDAAAGGDLPEAFGLWRQVLQTDPAAAFRAVGGIAFVLRRWIAAHQMRDEGMPIRSIAPKVMMWGREKLLESLLKRLSGGLLRQLLADLATLDTKAKLGLRSIDSGVQALLLAVARPTR
jgi:DNA polymerase-3 subunit delta